MKSNFLKPKRFTIFFFLLLVVGFAGFETNVAKASINDLTCGFSGKTVGTYLQSGDTIGTFTVSEDYNPAFFVGAVFPTGTTLSSGAITASDFSFVQNGSTHSPDAIFISGTTLQMQINPFTLYAGSTITLKMSATAGGTEIKLPTTATSSGSFSLSSGYAGTQTLSNISLVPDTPTHVAIMTAADSSGISISDQNLTWGSTLTAYSNSFDQYGNFVENIAADSWSLDSKTGSVSDSDLVAASSSKSAVFTGNNEGTTKIKITKSGFTAATSGTITVVKYFAGGSGTSGDPYQIENCLELQNMNYKRTAHFILTKDINCSATGIGDSSNSKYDANLYNSGAGFTPIGSNDSGYFSGTLDGKNFTISNLTMHRDYYPAIFYQLSDATVKNLKVDGVDIIEADGAGTIASYVDQSTLENINITNANLSSEYDGKMGGLAYQVSGSSVLNNLSFDGNISCTGSSCINIGGLVGEIISSTITKSYSQGTISGDGSENIGGLIGYMENAHIENTYSTANVEGKRKVGGLVGFDTAEEEGTIVNSYASGNVSGLENVGGLVGFDYGDQIINSYAAGKITNSGEAVGGLVGYLNGGNANTLIVNSGWYKYSDGPSYAIGFENASSSHVSEITYNVTDNTVFYNNAYAIYIAGDSAWDFNNIWYVQSGDYPKFSEEAGDDSNDSSDNTENFDEPLRAKITSWDAYQYTDSNKDCSNRLKLVIKGRHFDNDAEVQIGGHDASSINVKNSQKIVAKFCLDKLLSNQTDHKRTITVKNPDTEAKEADKKIDLDNLVSEDENSNPDYYNPKTQEGTKHIQQALNKLGYLDQENVTGTYGSITMEAVKKFQTDNSIEATGFVGEKTKAKLREKMGK